MRRRLGQEVALTDVVAEAPPSGESIAPEQASMFGALWVRFTQLWPEALAMRDEIAGHRARWEALASQAYAAGDIEGFRAYSRRVTDLDALERDRAAVVAQVERFREAWYALRDWLRGIGSWFGVSSLGQLGLPPVVLAVGAATAIATLGWVVNTILRLRNELDQDRQVLEAAERGVLPPAEAARVLVERERGAPWISVGPGGLAFSTWLLIGAGVLVALWAFGRRA